MSERISIGQLYPRIQQPAAIGKPLKNQSNIAQGQQASFKQILDDNVLKLSHHAEMRMQQRGMAVQPEQWSKIEAALEQAASKGAKESLVLLNDMALIVNVQNRTVVTAMQGSAVKNNVFTQIDSAIVIS